MTERTHVDPAHDPHADLLRFLAELLLQDYERESAPPSNAKDAE